jgi:hypothetical protein
MAHKLELKDSHVALEFHYLIEGDQAKILSAAESIASAALALHRLDPLLSIVVDKTGSEYDFDFTTADGRTWHYDFRLNAGVREFGIQTGGWFQVEQTNARTLLRDRVIDFVYPYDATKVECVFTP